MCRYSRTLSQVSRLDELGSDPTTLQKTQLEDTEFLVSIMMSQGDDMPGNKDRRRERKPNPLDYLIECFLLNAGLISTQDMMSKVEGRENQRRCPHDRANSFLLSISRPSNKRPSISILINTDNILLRKFHAAVWANPPLPPIPLRKQITLLDLGIVVWH